MGTMQHGERRPRAADACPRCGADRVGRSAYCPECGDELPSLGRASLAHRGLVVLFALAWTILVVSIFFWLTNHTLILK